MRSDTQFKKGMTPWNKGKKGFLKHTEEWKQKMREIMKGRKITWGDKISEAQKGKKLSEEHKKKLSLIKKGKPGNNKGRHWTIPLSKRQFGKIGERSNSWKGGNTPKIIKIRQSIEGRLWRESVFARDNYACQKCGEKGIYLQAHHFQNFTQYPELRFAIDNGATLCRKCHQKFHKKYGKKNNTIKQYEDFLNH